MHVSVFRSITTGSKLSMPIGAQLPSVHSSATVWAMRLPTGEATASGSALSMCSISSSGQASRTPASSARIASSSLPW